VSEPILRATDALGEVYDDPSEDALYMFIEDLASPESALRVERLDPEHNDEWAIVTLSKSGLYAFESNGHVKYVSSLREIHKVLTRWAFDLSGS
jgi:hypothetical protein